MISYTISNEKVDQKLRYKGYQMLVSDKISDARKHGASIRKDGS